MRIVVFTLVAIMASGVCQAGLVVTGTPANSTVNVDASAQTVDLTIAIAPTGTDQDVSGGKFVLDVTGPGAATFTGLATPAGGSPFTLLSTNVDPSVSTYLSLVGAINLTSSTDIAEVTISVPQGVLGTYTVVLTPSSVLGTSEYSDGVTPDLAYSNVGSTIATISAVPEPGAFAFMGLVSLVGAAATMKRRQGADAEIEG